MRGEGKFILQASYYQGRDTWFDRERYLTQEAAERALRHERASQQARIDSWGGTSYTGQRVQSMRVVMEV